MSVDVFEAFLEAGDIFHAPTAERLLRHVYSSGNSVAPGDAFRAFRGREPAVQAMLRKKGLDGEC
jgi:peptidyl-dipeptidase Dcp